jgi:hypothetical protein
MEIKNGIAYLGKMKTFRVFFMEDGEITTLKMKEKSEKELRIRLRGIPIHHVEELEVDTQSKRIKKLKGFLNNFDFDQLSTSKN